MPPSSHKQMKTLASYCNTLKGKQKITEKKLFEVILMMLMTKIEE
jgi:hypothetical protein